MNLILQVHIYDYEIDELVYYEDDLLHESVKAYENRYKTSVEALLAVSHRSSRYGSIGGHGCTGYRLIDGYDDLVSILGDDFEFSVSKSGHVILQTGDHDGSNYIEFMPITGKMLDKNYGLIEECRYGDYESFDKLQGKLKQLKAV